MPSLWVLIYMTEGRDHHRSMVPGFPCPTHASAGGTAGHLPPVGLGLPSTLVGGPLYFSLTGGPCSSLPFSRLKVLKPQSTEPWLCLSGGNSQKLPAVSAQSPSRARSRGPRHLYFCGLVFSKHSHCTVGNLTETNRGSCPPVWPDSLVGLPCHSPMFTSSGSYCPLPHRPECGPASCWQVTLLPLPCWEAVICSWVLLLDSP